MAVLILKRKWHKITVAGLLILTTLTIILSFLINKYWSPILAGTVKDVVLKSSDSLYNVDFSSVELQIIRGSIVINNITLKPDTDVYNAKKKKNLAPNNLVELHIKKLTLKNIHPLKLYFEHKLDIGAIIMNSPHLNVSYQLNHTKDTVVKDNRTPWQKISKSLKYIHVGKILLGDVKFQYKDYSGNKLAVSELKELYLSATDLLIDSTTQTDKSRLLFCKDIVAELNNYSANTANGLYNYKIKFLRLSTQKSQLYIEGINLQPVATDVFFTKTHKDRFMLHLDSLRLNHFDFLNYHKYRKLNASTLALNNGTLEIFSNPNHSPQQTDKINSFPNVGLFKINSDMKIDTIQVNNMNVVYREYNEKSNKAGFITFNNTTGRILNVTTNPLALQKNNISTVNLSTYFMNRGKLSFEFNFNLTDKENSFSYKGSLGPMELKQVNAAAMPLAMVKITSGSLKEFSFDINANRNTARGTVKILYNNLKVNVLKADTNYDILKKQTFASFYANLFILKHDNPEVEGGIARSVNVNLHRADETPFFKFVWQSILTGIKPAIGLDEKNTTGNQSIGESVESQQAKS